MRAGVRTTGTRHLNACVCSCSRRTGQAAEDPAHKQQQGGCPPPSAKAGPEVACSSLLGNGPALGSPPSALLPGLEAGFCGSPQHLPQQGLDGVLLRRVALQGCEGLGHRVSGHFGDGQAHACLHSPGQLAAILHMHTMVMVMVRVMVMVMVRVVVMGMLMLMCGVQTARSCIWSTSTSGCAGHQPCSHAMKGMCRLVHACRACR